MMQIKKKVLAISGSTRSKSTNESILKAIANWYSEDVEVFLYKGIGDLPHFNPDISDKDTPASVKKFRELVDKSDGVIICTPEYVFSLPGSLKNAIEWTVSTTVFSHKPVALIVASASGEKAFEALKLIMGTIEAKTDDKMSILIRGAKGKFNKDGEVIDNQVSDDIKMVVDSLIKAIDESKKAMIENYVSAYNHFNVQEMLNDLHKDLKFENISDGKVNLTTNGIEEFKRQAAEAVNYFKEREQIIKDINIKGNEAVVKIDYKGVLAIDFPNGLKAGDKIEMKGRSVFKFCNNKISEITDIS